MEFEFDPAKDVSNRAKHGLSLRIGFVIIEQNIGLVVDRRRDYGEARFNAYGLVDGRLHVCTFTMRGDVFRIISVRRASRQERQEWFTLN